MKKTSKNTRSMFIRLFSMILIIAIALPGSSMLAFAEDYDSQTETPGDVVEQAEDESLPEAGEAEQPDEDCDSAGDAGQPAGEVPEQPADEVSEQPDVEEIPAQAPADENAAKAPGEGKSEPIRIVLRDYDGNPLDASELGSGFDLVYYEFPVSLAGVDVTSTSSAYILYSYLMTNYASLESYKGTIRITDVSTDLNLNMEEAASPDEPYVLIVVGGSEMGYDTIAGKEWNSIAMVWYDGNDVHILDGQNPSYAVTWNSDDSIYEFPVIHDDLMIYPKLRVTFDSSGMTDENVYPLNISSGLAIMSQDVTDPSDVTAAQDGEYTLTLNKPVSRHVIGTIPYSPYSRIPAYFVVTMNDVSEEIGWYIENSEELNKMAYSSEDNQWAFIIGDVDDDGYLLNVITGEPVTVHFKASSPLGIKPSVLVRFSDPSDVTTEEDFPLYVRVAVTDNYDASWFTSKVVKLEKSDINKDFVVTFDKRDPYLDGVSGYPYRPLTFTFSVYKDENLSIPDYSWGDNGYIKYSYMTNPDLEDNVWKNPYYKYHEGGWYETGPMELVYNMVVPEIPVSVFATDASAMYPAYLKISAFGKTKVVELTENGDISVALEKVNSGSIYGRYVYWTVYEDPECTTVHRGWNVENRSELVGWDGQRLIKYYDYEKGFAINLTAITADELSVPMDVSLGDRDPGLFFPVYMQATLYSDDNGFTPVTVTEKLNSAEEATHDVVFAAKEGEKFNGTVSGYNIDVEFFKDEELTVSAGQYWSNASPSEGTKPFEGELGSDGKLHDGIEELKLIYRPVTVDVDPDLYKFSPSSDKPLVLRASLKNGSAPEVMSEETESPDGGLITVKFDHLAYVGEEFTSASAEMREKDREYGAVTSENTYFYEDSQKGRVSPTGFLKAEEKGKLVLKPYESPGKIDHVDIPIHMNIPEDGNYEFYILDRAAEGGSGYTGDKIESVYVSLMRLNPQTGNIEYVSYNPNYDFEYPSYTSTNPNNGHDNSMYGYCHLSVDSFTEANDYRGTLTVNMKSGWEEIGIEAGTYYMSYSLAGRRNSAYSYVYTGNKDYGWTNEEMVKVILNNDGTLTFEDGTPVSLELYYTKKYAMPDIDVLAEYPDAYNENAGRYSWDGYTPSFLYYYLSPVNVNARFYDSSNSSKVYLRTGAADSEGNMIANIPEGESRIGRPYDRYVSLSELSENGKYQTEPPVISRLITENWGGYDGVYCGDEYSPEYNEGNDGRGLPVGDYKLTYYMAYYSDYGNYEMIDGWDSAIGVKVHFAEDGKLYAVNDDGTYDTEPYVIHIRYKGDKVVDSLKINVFTTLNEGVDPNVAFKEGDDFGVLLSEWSEGKCLSTRFAIGSARITEPGLTEMEIKSPDGSPLVIRATSEYNLSYVGTFHNYTQDFPIAADANKSWAYYPHFQGQFDKWNYEYTRYFNSTNVDENGYVKGFSYGTDYTNPRQEDGTGGEILTVRNECLILPWQETDPGEISQAEDDGVVYKPITNISAIKEKGNYIIVVRNNYDNKWYALYCDEAGGNSVELKGVDSYEDLEAGYKVGSSSEYQRMIFNASKLAAGSDSVSMQLKTSYKGEDGKTVALKMGASNDDPEPLLSSSAGTVIIRNSDLGEGLFTVTKGNYAYLWYVDELYGFKGFRTVSNKYGPWHISDDGYGNQTLFGVLNGTTINSSSSYQRWVNSTGNPIRYNYYQYSVFSGVKDYAYPGSYSPYDKYMLDIDTEKYLNDDYLQSLKQINSMPGYGQNSVYILSDDTEDEPQEHTNKYTLVKTYGDFVNTFVDTDNGTPGNSMVLVYEGSDGKEYAMDPKGLAQVATKAGGSGYRTLTTIADHELIPNNNSGTSAHFSVDSVEVKNEGIYVFATDYAFRKSRQNDAEKKNYLTLKDDQAWANSDDMSHGSGLKYVLTPTEDVHSQADWDEPQSYTLSVIRNGSTFWLGVAEDENGVLQMVTVDSEADAAVFKIYSNQLKRYYSSANGTDLYKYYRVYSITDINANDEILIVYNDGEERHVVGYPFPDDNNVPAVRVLDEYRTIDSRDGLEDMDSRYMFRLATSEYVKKPFACFDAEDSDIILAQGVAANVIGKAKSETAKQRKYESVMSLGNQATYICIKEGYQTLYTYGSAETNFFPAENEGEFYIRGGKSNAWLGTGSYQRRYLNIETGNYEMGGDYLKFRTVAQDDRVPVEVYRRPTVEGDFIVEYNTVDKEPERREKKPMDSFTLTQNADTEENGTEYIFVGWTTDPEKAGYLSLEDSANLYDFDDLSKTASLKSDKKEELGVLGDCNPEVSNLIEYSEIEDKVVDGVLKVYPVYAVRGYSTAVAANDVADDGTETMIVGASDYKDQQFAGSGATDPKERWLGSIDIEVYKDGGTWAPGGSTTGKRNAPIGGLTVRKGAPAAGEPVRATLYFAYHNDDAADLNIKFIGDEVTAETLYDYLSNDEFEQAEPSEQYLIDAVYAEQGGSEDGLKYMYNWLDDVVGGQLDNVKGGSTVRIYVTSKYQVKYYFDDDGDGEYDELKTGTVGGEEHTWTNENYYTTAGTENAVKAVEENADYVVTDDNDYSRLLVRDDRDDGTRFKDEKIARGEYSVFLYKFNEYDHVIPIDILPEAPEGHELDSDTWTVKKPDMSDWTAIEPSTDMEVTETTYGTGNSKWSYLGEDLGDTVNTFHLYIAVETPGSLMITKIWDDADDQDGLRPDADAYAASISLVKLVDNEWVEVTGFEPVITDNGDGTYTVEYTGLPDTGKITYGVKETLVDGYIINGDKTILEMVVQNEGSLTNTHKPEPEPKTEIEVIKVWDDSDDKDGLRPDSITVWLIADGKETGKSITITEKDGWKGKFTDLDVYADGRKILYTVREEQVEGYEMPLITGSPEDGFKILNKHVPETTPPPEDKPGDDGPVPTGDDTGILAYAAAFVIALAGVASMLAAGFRRRRNRR